MCTLYERIVNLCKKKGVSGSRMCLDLGLSKSTLSNMKNGRTTSLSTANAQKIADYLGVTVGYLLGAEEKEKPTDDGELSPFAQKAVELFNDVPEEQKPVVLAMLRAALGLPE